MNNVTFLKSYVTQSKYYASTFKQNFTRQINTRKPTFNNDHVGFH